MPLAPPVIAWAPLAAPDAAPGVPGCAGAGSDEPCGAPFAPVGGESGLQVTARALPALLQLVETHEGMPFVVVSHKATIRLLLSSLIGFDPRKYRDRLDQSPAALNILDFKDAANARLTLFNDVSHYQSEVPGVPVGRLSPVWGK